MNDETEAIEKFQRSEERLYDSETLGKTPEDRRKFLANRFWAAFTAGMTAGKEIAAKRIARVIEGT